MGDAVAGADASAVGRRVWQDVIDDKFVELGADGKDGESAFVIPDGPFEVAVLFEV